MVRFPGMLTTNRYAEVEVIAPTDAADVEACKLFSLDAAMVFLGEVEERTRKLLSLNGRRTVNELHRELGRVMWEHVGMARSEESLGKALKLIPGLRAEFWEDARVTGSNAELNQELEAAGVRVVETDLGEFVVQLAGDHPSHIIAPIVHRTRDEVAALFRRKLGASDDEVEDIPAITALARRTLRREFLAADMGISGANFAVAETGSLCIVTNEGNVTLHNVTLVDKVGGVTVTNVTLHNPDYIAGFDNDGAPIRGGEDLRKELLAHVRKVIGPIATPDKLQFADALPRPGVERS
jgi:hypothetical protein